MADVLDVRGLSCPVPAVQTKRKLDTMGGSGLLEVLVDTDTARENVTRLAAHNGWRVDERAEADGWRLILTKG